MRVEGISQAQARRIALRAQGLLGAPDRRDGVPGVLRRLGAVQLDTISVLARSHELVAYARLGAVPRAHVEAAYWSGDAAFEYWSHAACVLPVDEWPWFAFRRRAYRARGRGWHEVDPKTCDVVRARLAADGPLTATQLGGARLGGPWWDWSATKVAVEWLLRIGEVVVTRRVGWRRVYDLADRALRPALTEPEPSDEECLTRLVEQAGRALGVATEDDLADYHRLSRGQVHPVVEGTGLVPVQVEGWPGTCWAHDAALTAIDRVGRHRTTLLSPFDSLIWDRRRTERLFGLSYRLEAYLPKEKRVHGYFAMPVLAGGRLVGLVDPGREGRSMVVKRASLTRLRDAPALAGALTEAASWVGCDDVRLAESLEPDVAHALRAALHHAAS